VIIIGKLIEIAVWMLSMPFCVEVAHVQSTSTATKDSEKGMVPHMPDSAAQCCASRQPFAVAVWTVNRQQQVAMLANNRRFITSLLPLR
jgi:hypothetical protein